MVNEANSIKICGELFDIGSRVIRWDSSEGSLSLYPGKNYTARNVGLEDLKKQVNGLVIHHSVTYTAKQTFDGLNGRGLSVNFIIDDDNVDGYATLYQCLDVKDAGWSHKPYNLNMPGVEVSYWPTTDKDYYSKENIEKYKVHPHNKVEDIIHGFKRTVHQPTQAQINTLVNLAVALSKALGFECKFPRVDGKLVKTTVLDVKGLTNHFHLTKEKWDAAGLDMEKFEKMCSDKLSTPLVKPRIRLFFNFMKDLFTINTKK